MKVEISIVTVAFNGEKTIRRAIESVLNQSYQPKEYLIIDGLSKDSTVSIAQEYAERFKEKGIEYKIVSEKDKGIYDAMNKGITMATGQIVGMINCDDWYEKDALKIVADTYEKEAFDMMYADINLVKENGNIIRKAAKIRKFITSRDWNHPTTFITKEVYNQGLYALDNLYADFDMMMRIRKKGCKVVVVNQVLANFAVGGVSNEKSFGSVYKRIKYRYNAYRKNNYSRLYIFECVFIEVAKLILA